MVNEKTATFYSSEPQMYEHLIDRLHEVGYRVSQEPVQDPFMLDPSIRSGRSGNLYEGSKNLVLFVLHEERISTT